MKKRTGVFFAIAAAFAAFGIIFSLVCGASVIKTDREAAQISGEIEQLENDVRALKAAEEKKYSLEEIETYAKNVLQMENMRPENVILLSIEAPEK